MAEERFHIAEWYGRPFTDLSDAERLKLAGHIVGGSAMSKAEQARMIALEEKGNLKTLSRTEAGRLAVLRGKLVRQQANEQPCPFRADRPHPTCTKPGGVCSIRIYHEKSERIAPVDGERGRLRVLCPWRFHQDGIVFNEIGKSLLSDPSPQRAGEVGFLESTGNLDSEPGEDVGRIDMILLNSRTAARAAPDWVAVEVQAVYFSGRKMSIDFKHLERTKGKLSMSRIKRRPDYRSSGVKRLMPQLLTKVPTLRRWGKKMAVIVDAPFFYSMGKMPRAPDISNADIVWFLVDFHQVAPSAPFQLEVVETQYTTLENAVLGLTGGVPLTRDAFEERIMAKAQK